MVNKRQDSFDMTQVDSSWTTSAWPERDYDDLQVKAVAGETRVLSPDEAAAIDKAAGVYMYRKLCVFCGEPFETKFENQLNCLRTYACIFEGPETVSVDVDCRKMAIMDSLAGYLKMKMLAGRLEYERNEMAAALREAITALINEDEEGLSEHAEPVARWRALIAKVRDARAQTHRKG